MKDYGKELILDIHECNIARFNRKDIKEYFIRLCDKIRMERCALHWWDDKYTPKEDRETEPHLVGISAVQFIKTSNIIIHSLPLMGNAHINIFSCKSFSSRLAEQFSVKWFGGKLIQSLTIRRI